MRTIISQSVILPVPAESLFAMYTDPAKHAAITGAPVVNQRRAGFAIPSLQWRAHRCDAPDHPSTAGDPVLALDQI